MDATGAVAGAVAALALGPLLAGLTHSAPQTGPWWAPWRPTGRRLADTPPRDRLASTAGSVIGAGLAGGAAGWGAAWPAFVLVGLLAGPLAVVDVRLHRLPDRIVLPALLATAALLGSAALARGESAPLVRALVSAAVGFAVLFALTLIGRRAFGPGDAKTGALLALLLGWISIPAVAVGLWAGFAVGAVAAAALVATRRLGWREHFAFGPGLLLGALGVAAAFGS